MTDRTARSVPADAAVAATGPVSGPLRLYLIEDDPAMREAIATALGQALPQLEVVGFGDNERSVTHWLSSHDRGWDVAVVDLQLRQGSGYAALRWCATRMPQQQVVVLSALVDEDVRARCLALGADAVFEKTGDIGALVDFCRSRLGLATAPR